MSFFNIVCVFLQLIERTDNGHLKNNTSSPIVILTKHCTVRLDRIPKLDMLNNFGPICVDQMDTQHNNIDNNTVNNKQI